MAPTNVPLDTHQRLSLSFSFYNTFTHKGKYGNKEHESNADDDDTCVVHCVDLASTGMRQSSRSIKSSSCRNASGQRRLPRLAHGLRMITAMR